MRIARGTITGLLGPSGCGKTTLMRSIVGHADHRVRHGHGARPAGRLRRHCGSRVGYVPQDPTIYDDLRVIDNVRYFASLYGSDASAADDAVDRRRPRPITEPRSAATSPAVSAPGCRWPARWWRSPSCWCSTNRPSGLDPVLRVDLWEQFHELARARHHAAGVEPRDGRGRPLRRPAADARGPPARAHHADRNYERTPDARHWRKRFCPSSGTAPRPEREPAEPAGLPAPPRRGSCGSWPPTTAASR